MVSGQPAWAKELQTPANKAFVTAYQKQYHQEADSFAALGYDTARLIGEALKRAGRQATQSKTLLEALATAQFTATTPFYLREVRQDDRFAT